MEDNQLLLPSGKIIIFNSEQLEALEKIRTWLKGDKTFFTLAGYSGTGKTCCIKKILDSYYGNIVVSAPTHKAKQVIAKLTSKNAKTLHSLLGLRPDLELSSYNPNDPQFSPIALPKITDYGLVVIDEASMINQELYDLIIEKTNDSGTKILFMGDPAQIPPVGEKESAVFNQDIEKNEFYQLTKIERQNDTNPMFEIYDAVRNNLLIFDGGFIRKTEMNENGEGVIFTTDKPMFRKAILDKFKSKEFEKDTNFVKVIAWKNETVMKSNFIIRTALFGDNTDIVEIGDVLMGYRTISTENQKINIIENSADYRIIEKSELEENKYGIKGYWVKLSEEINENHFKYQEVFIINSNDHENLHLYGQMHDFFRDTAKSNKKLWKKYYEFRRCNLLMKNINEYINGIIRKNTDVIKKDLDYGFVITGHKAQGSTYSHAFIMLNDIENNWIIKERNQIFYVAITRPSISAMVLL